MCSTMTLIDAYLGLGGNIGQSLSILQEALTKIAGLNGIYDVIVSRFYKTKPVSDIPQPDFINAVCKFKTSLSADELLKNLQQIEKSLGKTQKAKNAPRVIDLDCLFFGNEQHQTETLTIPHPHWQDRLFVLVPLLDLVSELDVPTENGLSRINLKERLKNFNNHNNEIVMPLELL